ncbi:endonuclease V, partial [bacterium]|nr:endonuclease V [bacterium]
MRIKRHHPFDVSYHEARLLQQSLAKDVITDADFDIGSVGLVAGTDVSYSKATNRCYSAVVVLSFPDLDFVCSETSVVESTFPYIPGLLSFREIPGLMKAFENLARAPHLLIVDGQGVAHPRRMGLASHLGLLLDLPSIGCAKSRLVGEHGACGVERGSTTDLI